MRHRRWQVSPPVPSEVLARWPKALDPIGRGIPPLLVQLLWNRGLADPIQAETFLAADERLLGDPWLLPDLEKALERLKKALTRGEVIAIFGDYDADGITATAILAQTLFALGARVVPYIPHRTEEGYGLNRPALEALAGQGVRLVVTVDCGVTALAEIAWAREQGLDIIVTDHHLPLPQAGSSKASLPPAVAVIDPQRPDSAYPFPHLAGSGVAWKVAAAFLAFLGKDKLFPPAQLLDLVALGTVADLAPLVGENRYLVRQGLRLLNNPQRPGLVELMRQARLNPGSLDAHSIAYLLGPRLNAAGRLDHARLSYQLLTTESRDEARSLAAALEEMNRERQRLTEEVLRLAEAKLGDDHAQPLLLVGEAGWPAGVLGLVASRLVDRYYRPALVLEIGKEASRGSARSIPEFHITQALARCADLLHRFGGHTQAAGFSLATERLPEFQKRLLQVAREHLDGLDLRPTLQVDAEQPLASLSGDTLKVTGRLAPFGAGNAEPAFLSRGVKVLESRALGPQGEHLRLKLREGAIIWHAVGFGLGSFLPSLTPRMDIVYNLAVDERSGLQELHILDLAPEGRVDAGGPPTLSSS